VTCTDFECVINQSILVLFINSHRREANIRRPVALNKSLMQFESVSAAQLDFIAGNYGVHVQQFLLVCGMAISQYHLC
jgi:hypothetical protein